MRIVVSHDAAALGRRAAEASAAIMRAAIERDGVARIVLSTGQSQFTTFEALAAIEGIDWSKVEAFHLDEYIGLPESHPASFRKYLRERFVNRTGVGRMHFVEGDPSCIAQLCAELNRGPVHLGLVGVGQNAHVAFNDPPADFHTQDAYIIVTMDENSRRQQVEEGWFASVDEVPERAISMSVAQIMRCENILSAVPYAQKADAVRRMLESPLDPEIPATILKTHPRFTMFVDRDSFAKANVLAVLPAQGASGFEMEVYTQ